MVSPVPAGVATAGAASWQRITVTSAFVPATGTNEASQPTAATAGSASDPAAGTVPLSLTIPEGGSFAATLVLGLVPLTVQGSGPYATGLLQGITLTDSRNYLPGWSVTGQASSLAAGRQALPASQLGWVPAGVVKGGAMLGPPVVPGDPGLDSPAILASALPGSGFGTDTLSAGLLLQVPPGAGDFYVGTLTITVVAAGP